MIGNDVRGSPNNQKMMTLTCNGSVDLGAVLADNLSRMPVKTLGLAILDLVLDCTTISRQQTHSDDRCKG